MALLINRLFSNRKKVYGKHRDCSDRTFSFTKEQVRIILFRECDFRGRKLLFDSETVQKIPVSSATPSKQSSVSSSPKTDRHEVYLEVSNGFGYQFARPSGDTVHLAEMVFGSVAMSFRGTSFKIHSFSSPPKLMCTQVFPSPRAGRGRTSVSSTNFSNIQPKTDLSHSLEKSSKFLHSGASSTTSFVEQNFDSDIKIVPYSSSVPLDVPIGSNNTATSKLTSLEVDSGFYGEHSLSSISSGPNSINLFDTRLEQVYGVSLTCGSLYKRYLRSASTSLDCSDNSSSGMQSSTSADECMARGHRSSKLGLAVVIQLTEHQEREMESFLLEHAALLESMICRARSNTEVAYARPNCFASLMYEMYMETCLWLSDVLSGTTIDNYLWHSISSRLPSPRVNDAVDCRLYSNSSLDLTKTHSSSNLTKVNSMGVLDRRTTLTGSTVELGRTLRESGDKRSSVHRSMLGLGRTDAKRSLFNVAGEKPNESSLFAEKFVKELCELLETVDVKHTNFFISTLLTAVLTHHLGWVSTVNPPTQVDKDLISKLPSSCNPLWGQLTDLYGAVGHPTKMSHTVICGNNKNDVIDKILNILTYFIRCSCVERNCLTDYSPTMIHKKEVQVSVTEPKPEDKFLQDSDVTCAPSMVRLKSMTRTKSYLAEMSACNLENNNNVESKNFMRTKGTDCDTSIPKNSSVVFVLGENEELVGINKKTVDNLSVSSKGTLLNEDGVSFGQTVNVESDLGKDREDHIENAFNIPSSSSSSKLQRPSDLKIPNKVLFSCSSDSSPDDSSSSNCIGVCAELSPCSECEKIRKRSGSLESSSSKDSKPHARSSVLEQKNVQIRHRDGDFNRSQSVPPSDKNKQQKCSKSGCKKKYSGVKFDIRQYPQIVTNYMRSKDLELSQLPFGEKALKLNRSFSTALDDNSLKLDFPSCDCEPHDTEALQTPSNASELEFTSDLEMHESITQSSKLKSLKEEMQSQTCSGNENNAIFEHEMETLENRNKNSRLVTKMTFIELPFPTSVETDGYSKRDEPVGYTRSLLKGVSGKYISDMVLQGTTSPMKCFENTLKRDLNLMTKQPLLDQPIQEAVAIIANTDTWEVQLMSSHTYIVEKGCAGVRVCLSQLVANMLESLLHMWKLHTPSEYCLMHIESRLREFCLRSKTLAQLLMSTEFCNMDTLTAALQLEVNDVPLLMAIASTHTPQLAEKYGLSFQ